MLNTTIYKTENNNKESLKRIKSLKESRVLSEANIKKGKTKLVKKVNHDLIIKDDKKEDIKLNTMSNFHKKGNAKDKNNKKNDELAKTFSETNISDKIKKNKDKDKFIKSEKKEKKNMTHFQTKIDVRINKKEKPEKKVEKIEKDIKKNNTNKKEPTKKEIKKEEKKAFFYYNH